MPTRAGCWRPGAIGYFGEVLPGAPSGTNPAAAGRRALTAPVSRRTGGRCPLGSQSPGRAPRPARKLGERPPGLRSPRCHRSRLARGDIFHLPSTAWQRRAVRPTAGERDPRSPRSGVLPAARPPPARDRHSRPVPPRTGTRSARFRRSPRGRRSGWARPGAAAGTGPALPSDERPRPGPRRAKSGPPRERRAGGGPAGCPRPCPALPAPARPLCAQRGRGPGRSPCSAPRPAPPPSCARPGVTKHPKYLPTGGRRGEERRAPSPGRPRRRCPRPCRPLPGCGRGKAKAAPVRSRWRWRPHARPHLRPRRRLRLRCSGGSRRSAPPPLCPLRPPPPPPGPRGTAPRRHRPPPAPAATGTGHRARALGTGRAPSSWEVQHRLQRGTNSHRSLAAGKPKPAPGAGAGHGGAQTGTGHWQREEPAPAPGPCT